jgi:hypothetical protein
VSYKASALVKKQSEENGMKNLQKAGGISAIIAAATYVCAMGLGFTKLSPLMDPALGFQDYMAFYTEPRI